MNNVYKQDIDSPVHLKPYDIKKYEEFNLKLSNFLIVQDDLLGNCEKPLIRDALLHLYIKVSKFLNVPDEEIMDDCAFMLAACNTINSIRKNDE